MQRRVGARLFDRTDLPRRAVEEHGRCNDAPPKGVNAAAIEVLAFIARIFFVSERHILPDAVRLIRFHRRAADVSTRPGRSPPAPGRATSTTASDNAARAPATDFLDLAPAPLASPWTIACKSRSSPSTAPTVSRPNRSPRNPPPANPAIRDATAFRPATPKSSGVRTRPAPKNCCQNRFTVTRAVNGFSGSTSQRAKPSRFVGASAGNAGNRPGVAAWTSSPRLS